MLLWQIPVWINRIFIGIGGLVVLMFALGILRVLIYWFLKLVIDPIQRKHRKNTK